MNPTASIRDFFKMPQWGMNLLLGALAGMIPIVGPMVLLGWHITVLWTPGPSSDPAKAPPFDFQHFSKYLERGLWPFLASLAVSLAILPLSMILLLGGFMLGTALETAVHPKHFPIITVIAVAGVDLTLMIAIQLFLVPVTLRAILTQDFKAAFNAAFIGGFVKRVWREILVALLFMLALGIGFIVIAVVTCYIGALFVPPVFSFSWHHLQHQLYQLYLARGGEPVPPSPKLGSAPPPLPAG